jgi:putative heme iron utilization protein
MFKVWLKFRFEGHIDAQNITYSSPVERVFMYKDGYNFLGSW